MNLLTFVFFRKISFSLFISFYCIYFSCSSICPLAFFGFLSEDLTFLKESEIFWVYCSEKKKEIIFFSWISVQGEKKRSLKKKRERNKKQILFLYIYFIILVANWAVGLWFQWRRRTLDDSELLLSSDHGFYLLPSGKFWVSLEFSVL